VIETIQGKTVGDLIPGITEVGLNILPGPDTAEKIRALKRTLPEYGCVWAIPTRQNGVRGYKIVKFITEG
jgi:hypothetical protein